MLSRFLSWLRQHLGFANDTSAATPEKAPSAGEGHLSVRMRDGHVSGKSVTSHYYGEQSVDVSFQNMTIEAREGDLDMYVRGGASKWILGQTKASIEEMKRADLLKLWEAYRVEGRNQSIKSIDAEVLKEDYEDTPEGLAELKEFIVGYLAVSNGEEAG